ncbi:MAG: hypothetical protein QXV17_06935 [Candidatus Micrarchaeaceae archaeon]
MPDIIDAVFVVNAIVGCMVGTIVKLLDGIVYVAIVVGFPDTGLLTNTPIIPVTFVISAGVGTDIVPD